MGCRQQFWKEGVPGSEAIKATGCEVCELNRTFRAFRAVRTESLAQRGS